MPELPDVEVYIRSLRRFCLGQPLRTVRIRNPFLLRSVEPPLETVLGKTVVEVRRLGKRIVIGLQSDLFLVIHLMIAGRLRWAKPGAGIPGRYGLAAFDFPNGALLFTEAGSKRRASLHVVRGLEALSEHDPGGLETLEASLVEFSERLAETSHTLKRALTDPRLFSGIGNAYSDEILHRAQLSPFRRTTQLSPDEVERLFNAIRQTLIEWTDRLDRETGERFPNKVTAFREGMAVHGRYGHPCPVCGSKVQRIVYAENEANYCAQCQTGGRLLADRALSRLLREDWPKTLDELEAKLPNRGGGGSKRR